MQQGHVQMTWNFMAFHVITGSVGSVVSVNTLIYLYHMSILHATISFAAKSVPFNIRFLSDLYESDAEETKYPNGFRLSYTMKSC